MVGAPPRPPIWIDGDETRLAQVLGNLLQNAAKFIRPGGRVTLSVLPAGDEAEIRVRDTGAGIEPDLLERVFEPFTQGRQTLARTETARRTAPDLVLCDIGLPGMSGYDVARALRTHQATGTQLVAVSGYARPEDLSAAAEAGFDRDIAQPADPEEIAHLLG